MAAGRPPHPHEQQRRLVARHLRAGGATYGEIARVLGVGKATAWELMQRGGDDDPAPPIVIGRNGWHYRSRRRPILEPEPLVCDTCAPSDGQHDAACPLRHIPPRQPRRAVNKGGPGHGLTPPDTWPSIVGKVANGATHAEVAAAFGVSRARITAIIARARDRGDCRAR